MADCTAKEGPAWKEHALILALILVAASLALVLLGWAHHWFWRGYLSPKDVPDEVHTVRTADGWRIGIRRYLPKGDKRYAEPVVLCHGLGANHYNLDWDPPYGLAQALAAEGRDCWVVSLRGHDGSDRPTAFNPLRWGFSFDDYLRFDVPAVLDHVTASTSVPKVQWVGHSMGGMLAYALGGGPYERILAGGVVAVASPSSFSNQPYLRSVARLGKWLARSSRVPQRFVTHMIAPFMGHFNLPFSEIAIAPQSMDGRLVRRLQAWAFEDISAGVARQFDDWVSNDAFRSLDKSQDYRSAMGAFTAPVLVMGGSSDKMAPPRCMEDAHRRLGSADKTLVILGKELGASFDYGHGDLMLGRAAPGEVYPQIARWLEARATRVG
ncbi:alpha/beta fold hydrolase [Vulgatibacter incomptus]|nr:alpha/beta fold hydrolase [Vulgatibacter incomptus]